MFDFISGPLVWISFATFLLGSLFQILRFFLLSEKKEVVRPNLPPLPEQEESNGFSLKTFKQRIALLKATSILGFGPFLAFVSLLFHLLLFAVPIFLLAHNILLQQALGISFFSFSEKTSDILTVFLIACVLVFLVRRLLIARVRSITSPYDYFILALASTPIITGFLAYHQIYNYKTVIIIHILSAELMLIAIPFTKLVHMVFFFLNRLFIESEYSLGPGNRTWKV